MKTIITSKDVRPYYCASGLRRWFERNGLDFKDFLANGVSADALRATGDPSALFIIERVESAERKAQQEREQPEQQEDGQ